MAKQAPVTKSNSVQSATRARSYARSVERKAMRRASQNLRASDNHLRRTSGVPTLWDIATELRFVSIDRMRKRAKWLKAKRQKALELQSTT